MYIKQFNECFGCTKSVLFPLNVPAPPLSMAEFREYNHVQLLKITPFIHWEMGFSRLLPIQYGREGDSSVFQVFVVLHPKPPAYTAVTCYVSHTYRYTLNTGIFLFWQTHILTTFLQRFVAACTWTLNV